MNAEEPDRVAFAWPALARPAADAAEQARERGYAEGRREGYDAGMAEAAAELAAVQQSNLEAVRAAAAMRARLDALDGKYLADASYAICRAILADELSHRPQLFQRLLTGAVEQLLEATSQAVEVAIHPEQADDYVDLDGVIVRADETLMRNCCVVTAPAEVVVIDPLAVIEELFAELRVRDGDDPG